MQNLLDSNSDVYLLDEPELGMGNSYITTAILPKIIGLAKQRKTVIIATHNANLAVATLPYMSILRTHKNGVYNTYVGNAFYDELRNIEDEKDFKSWTLESMHTLEGGKDAFYGRRTDMNQESKIINVKLDKRDKKDYMIFEFEEEIIVCLNEESGQSELKSVFSVLLTELIKNPVELEYIENKEYKVGLYIDVCKEYIIDLNREILRVRNNMPDRLNKINLKRE